MTDIVLPGVASALAPLRDSAQQQLKFLRLRREYAASAGNWPVVEQCSGLIADLQAKLPQEARP